MPLAEFRLGALMRRLWVLAALIPALLLPVGVVAGPAPAPISVPSAGQAGSGGGPQADMAAWWHGYEAGFVRTPDGRRLQVYCMGSGFPVVVFEAGTGGQGSGFRRVQPAISKTTRACVYTRAGFGHSDAAKGSRDLTALAIDLGVVVRAVGGGRPVVLVGHSFGGPITRYFAYGRPERVAGMVLIDPAGDDHYHRLFKPLPGSDLVLEQITATKRMCLEILERGPLGPGTDDWKKCVDAGPGAPCPPVDAPDALKSRIAQERGAAYYRASLAEDSWWLASPHDAQLSAKARRGLGDIPLIVLTAMQSSAPANLTPNGQAAFTRVWRQTHWEDAQLSTHGRRLFVDGAGHSIQFDRPEAVVDAVNRVVAEAQAKRR